MTKLVIVESPAKARTISTYLGKEFRVEASIGHIRDLPQPSQLPDKMRHGPLAKFAVDIENGFTPYYVVSSEKKKKVTELRAALKEADELYLATDEDREGEAIAWHLLEVLKPKIPVKRMVFHEITREAIEQALKNTRELDTYLVDAQETRRILDRLVGYEISPLLWRKIRTGLSAGRVQSVATRLVVERERERIAFIPAKYWDIDLHFSAADSRDATPDSTFTARLTTVGGKRLATGRDFDDHGQLKKPELLVMDQPLASTLGTALDDSTGWQVKSLETKPYTRRPAAPFTTSTLQQEASRKLRISSRDTMRLAQYLYENGYITYMRTDSTALSDQAMKAARSQAQKLYGPTSVPDKPRFYAKKAKGAQEAHEAIRPAGSTFRTPSEVRSSLDSKQAALYELIWKRTVASQMVDATGHTATVKVGTTISLHTPALDGDSAEVIASAAGTVITNRGFLAAYEEGRDAERYRATASQESLPPLDEQQSLTLQQVDWEDREHSTNPPPRYTEASLVKDLEEYGIGRPSTYASTIGTIIDRGYVWRRAQALVPSFLAFAVTRLLEDNLTKLVDYQFTASMEEDLDKIAAGELQKNSWLKDFWFGAEGSEQQGGLQHLVQSLLEHIDARETNTMTLSDDVNLRVGRFGPYLENKAGQRASIPDEIAPDELSAQLVEELFSKAADSGRELGTDPATGHLIIAKDGRYGPYVTEVIDEAEADETVADATSSPASDKPAKKSRAKKVKPRTASLFKSMDLSTVTLEQALQLLSQPREVGKNAEGEVITAQNGRYGPYVKCGSETRSLESEEQIFTLTEEEALQILAQPRRRGRGAAQAPLRELGPDPATEAAVVIKDGRFGPYITDGTTNVSVPRGRDWQEIPAQEAFDMLATKRAAGPRKRKTTAKKSTTRKTTAKKSAAKKPAAKKPAAK